MSTFKFNKMKNILKIVALSSLTFMLASCGTASDVYGNNPNNRTNNGNVYRAGDGQVYNRGEVYRDRTGNVYQNGRVIRTGDVYGNPGILGRNGNNNQVYYPNNTGRNLPPGQAKKIYGGKARDYAKGQQKNRNNSWKKHDDNDDRNDRRNWNKKEYKDSNKRNDTKSKDRDDD